jgi:hypothetical protein
VAGGGQLNYGMYFTNTASGDWSTIGGGSNARASGSWSTIGGGDGNIASGHWSTVGGGHGNGATMRNATVGGGDGNHAEAVGATIGGGGDGPFGNWVTDDWGTVGGGMDNHAGDLSGELRFFATVGGGSGNWAEGQSSTVAGGDGNRAEGETSSIGGGRFNTASGADSTVGGGVGNVASGRGAVVAGGGYEDVAVYYTNTASADWSTVGGGRENSAGGESSTVCGGRDNAAGNSHSTVGGGVSNVVEGEAATVPGGEGNLAEGPYSLAAGRLAYAGFPGCFVWGDASWDDYVGCEDENQFVARAAGGVIFYSSPDLATGVWLPPDGIAWEPWPPPSDRSLKDDLVPVDGQEVLARLAEIPISTWRYRTGDPDVRHMGPMAQDFYAAYGLGYDDEHLNPIDTNGVALAAIQALTKENASLREQVDGLEARLAALESRVGTGASSPWRSGFLLPGSGLLVVGLGVVWLARRERGGGR